MFDTFVIINLENIKYLSTRLWLVTIFRTEWSYPQRKGRHRQKDESP